MSAICHIHSQIIDKEHLRIGFNKYGEKIFGKEKIRRNPFLAYQSSMSRILGKTVSKIPLTCGFQDNSDAQIYNSWKFQQFI